MFLAVLLLQHSPSSSRGSQCGICDANNPDPEKRHPITNIVDGTNSWWQSPTLQKGAKNDRVTINLDLGQVSVRWLWLELWPWCCEDSVRRCAQMFHGNDHDSAGSGFALMWSRAEQLGLSRRRKRSCHYVAERLELLLNLCWPMGSVKLVSISLTD